MANGYGFASSQFIPAAFSGIGKVTVMSQPELKRTLDLIEPASAQATPAQTNESTADKIIAAVPSGNWSHEKPAPPYFDHALQDAERLLNYAADPGIDVDSETRINFLPAR